jgi:hypothetical protein
MGSSCAPSTNQEKGVEAWNSSPIVTSWVSKAWKNDKENKKKGEKGIGKHEPRMWVGRSKEKVGRS